MVVWMGVVVGGWIGLAGVGSCMGGRSIRRALTDLGATRRHTMNGPP